MKYSVILFLLIAFQGKSQYTVIHTIGKIYDTETKSYLSKGSRVSENASLKFETKEARAAVLSSSRGRFVIQQKQSSNAQSDAIYALKSVISPVRGRLSTRSGSINNTLDFQKYFNEGTVALLGKTFQVEVSPGSFPMSERKFFYAQYSYKGEAINKKLGNSGQQLVIGPDEFFSIDSTPIDPALIQDAKLFYYDADNGVSKFITDMDIIYVSDEVLQSLASENPDDAEAVTDFINSMYGKCSIEQVDMAISSLE